MNRVQTTTYTGVGALVAVVVATVCGTGAFAADGETVDQKIRSWKADSPVTFSGEVTATYTDNLFHYSDERLADFDDEKGKNERFEGLGDPEDVVTRVRAGLSWKHRLSKKRHFRVSAEGSHFFHASNGVADYTELGAGLSVDATKKSRFFAGIEYVPERFKKNYLFDRVGLALTEVFEPAEYDQLDLSVGYERRIRKHWATGIVYRNRERSFNPEFTDRDQEGDYADLYTSYRITKRLDGLTEVGFGSVDTGLGTDLGVTIDRSYDQLSVAQDFELQTRGRLRLGFRAELRRREFTTNESDDTARYNREDDRLKLTAKADIPLTDVLSLTLRAGWVDNDSLRERDGIEADETGYEEMEAGVGLKIRF